MFVDPSVRYLALLGGGCTGRLVNLVSLREVSGSFVGAAAPLFFSPVLNYSLLMKHRVRPHEEFLFSGHTEVATKIVVPVDPENLAWGGHSFFINQRGFKTKLTEIGQYRNGQLEHDLRVLQLIADLPSLDFFILREAFRQENVGSASGPLDLPFAQRAEMMAFAAGDVLPLVQLVMGADQQIPEAAAARLVFAFLSEDIGPKLEPLRLALSLEHDEFRKGMISWRVLLYHKWQLHRVAPQLELFFRDLSALRLTPESLAARPQILQTKKRIADLMRASVEQAQMLFDLYDATQEQFICERQPRAFREILLNAPHDIPQLGQISAAITHILVVWQIYSTAEPGQWNLGAIMAMLQDFESCFVMQSQRDLLVMA